MQPADAAPSPVLPFITFLIATHNRREVLLETLARLAEAEASCGMLCETIVVDNASTDGTADAVLQRFPAVELLLEKTNRGPCAKNRGLARANGRFVMFLDDDSYPTPPSLRAMVEYFIARPSLGAAIFNIILPDGRRECSAYPSVFIGCGTAFRRAALDEAGGLPENFFMGAEEYDLSIRLLERGWNLQRFEDLFVHHAKTPLSRRPARTMRLDVRNNFLIATRYFPRGWLLPMTLDWMRRYRWIALAQGWRHTLAFWAGLAQGLALSIRPGHRKPLSLQVFEHLAMPRQIREQLAAAVRAHGYQRVLLVDVGKNILPFMLAARKCKLQVVGVADERLHRRGRRYRGAPVVDDHTAAGMVFDVALIANVSPVHAAARAATWRRLTRRPVLDLFEPGPAATRAMAA